MADDDNALDWLYEVPHGEDDGSWEEFIGGVGSMVMGATTYEQMLTTHALLANPQRWHDFYGDRPAWVFTHRNLPKVPTASITMVAGDVRPVHAEMIDVVPDRNIWLLGGGELAGQFDDAGLLDEIWLGMRPVLLNAGAPLLPRRISSKRLTLREVRHSGQVVRLVLDVIRP